MRVRETAERARQELARHLAEYRREKENGGAEAVPRALELARRHEALAGQLYRVRATLPPSDPFRARLEDYFADASHEMLSLQSAAASDPARRGQALLDRYRRVWRDNIPLLIFTWSLFLLGIATGWNVAAVEPDFVGVLVSQEMIEEILDRHRWFGVLSESPAVYGLMIAWNNIQVAITGFTLGAVFGLGTLYVLLFNGLHFGVIMGFCASNGFHQELTRFVVGHGPLELSILVASCFAGFLFGRVFYMRPWSLLPARMGVAAGEAGIVMLGVVPWLVLAAVVESFLSPREDLAFEWKVGIGAVLAALFWFWTFPPRWATRPILRR